MDISFSVGPDIRRGCMRWGVRSVEWGASELGKAWAGTALLDPLFEQQAHSRRRGVRQMWMRLFPSKPSPDRVGSSRERRGVVWVCLACRAQGQGQGRVGGWVRFEVSFPVSQSVNRCDLVLIQTAVCDLQVWCGVVQETVRGSCRQMREVETSTQTKRGRTFLQVASPVLSVP